MRLPDLPAVSEPFDIPEGLVEVRSEPVPFGQNGLQEGMELFRAHHRLLQLREKKYSFIVK